MNLGEFISKPLSEFRMSQNVGEIRAENQKVQRTK